MKPNYFPASETKCQLTNQGGPCPHCNGANDITDKFRADLNELRALYGGPIGLSNAMRCEGRNRDAGGAPKSKHLLGRAADIKCRDAARAHQIALVALKLGFTVGVYSWGLHVDKGARSAPLLFHGKT